MSLPVHPHYLVPARGLCAHPPVGVGERPGHGVADVRQEDEQQRRGEHAVQDGEQLAGVRPRRDVAVADGGHDADREEQRVGEVPAVSPVALGAVVAVVLRQVHGELLQDVQLMADLRRQGAEVKENGMAGQVKMTQ